MIESTARVHTRYAVDYAISLCEHWHGRIDVKIPRRQGVIHFENAVATLTPSHDQLVITILANDNHSLQRLQGVVSSRLDRLSSRKKAPLKCEWQRTSHFDLHAL